MRTETSGRCDIESDTPQERWDSPTYDDQIGSGRTYDGEQGGPMTRSGEQRLELTWFNKDKALIPTETGRYGYTWVDPRDPRYCETRTLVMDEYVEGEQTPKEEGVVYSERADLEPTTNNLLVLGESGDVLEALTRVPELREKYARQIKCIYIDPPFNTGAVFGDSYEDNLEHSVWLTLMRDRLLHLRRLLRKDGTIWVHLDDYEVHRMRVLLDETFGPARFLGSVLWQKADGPRNDLPNFSVDHDTILVYGATDAAKLHQQNRDEALNAIYTSVDGDERLWYDGDPTAPSAHRNQTWVYAIQNPLTGDRMYPAVGRCWGAKQETVFAAMSEYAKFRLEVIDDDGERARICGVPVAEVRKGIPAIMLDEPLEDAAEHVAERKRQGAWPEFILRSKGTLGRKRIQPDTGTNVRTLWLNSEVGHNRQAKTEIKNLFPGETPFATPKPEALIAKIILAATEPGDIVLDCFAGSGTTVAVAHKLGRRWLACELKEDNFARYTRPRLEMVTSGADKGGVSTTERGTDERMLPEGTLLPEGISTPSEAWVIDRGFDKAARTLEARIDLSKMIQAAVRRDKRGEEPTLSHTEGKELLSLLDRLPSEEVGEIDFLPLVKRSVVRQVKTQRMPNEVNWRGGGGFQVAHLAPACFDYDPEIAVVTMTKAAQDPTVLTPEHRHFHGVRGAMRLYVTRDPLTPEYVTELASHVGGGESLTIASTVVLDGAIEAARKARRGSRVVHIPSDLFPFQTEGKR